MSTLYPEMVRELGTVFGNGRAMDEIRNIVKDNKADMKIRQRALTTLIEARPDDLRELCESLLDVRVLNGTALQGLSLSHDPSIAEKIARKYKRFQPEDRPRVIEVLVSRVAFANAILDVLDSKDNPIALTDMTPFHVRQLRSLGDTTLNARIAKSWGELRDSPAEKQAAIATEKQTLSPEVLAKADLAAGRALFEKTCSQCHMLYGSGAKIGPDLTGSQRSNLDYLLENILDPSAVVGKDYRMTLVQTNDGRTLSGLVVSNDGKVLVLQTQTTKETIAFSEIDQMKETNLSSMPDGLLTALSRDQVRDLIGYLMHPNQIATKATGE
jgi:putative heme-binding domain-containing protein